MPRLAYERSIVLKHKFGTVAFRPVGAGDAHQEAFRGTLCIALNMFTDFCERMKQTENKRTQKQNLKL